MLNWSNLTAQQKLAGIAGLVFCLLLMLALWKNAPPGRMPPFGVLLIAVGAILHPGMFIKGRRTLTWPTAPVLVKLVWTAGMAAAAVSVTHGFAAMFA